MPAKQTAAGRPKANWSPISGCEKISPGCQHCFSAHEWPRLARIKNSIHHGRKFNDVACHPERVGRPLRIKEPSLVAVAPSADVFHASIPDQFLDQIFAVIAACPQHTFELSTKRTKRMHDYLHELGARPERLVEAAKHLGLPELVDTIAAAPWPLPNLWLAVSFENQDTANERVAHLLNSPAAKRCVYAEPLLGPIDLQSIQVGTDANGPISVNALTGELVSPLGAQTHWPAMIDRAVLGGEFGTRARPMHSAWVTFFRDQCLAAETLFMFRGWGEWIDAATAPAEAIRTSTRGVWVHLAGNFHSGLHEGSFRQGDQNVIWVGRAGAPQGIEGISYRDSL